ncbi:DeoR/GlpR family DNA-binding transcription regulator [Pedobacter sp. ASV1-7]|uniref:DeoR/GlpR family DNA-binding transcription regulator n=1 Tax=Pedobacter sp. ASV1-7 TaxID=3145237 RepID=UPI0032E87FA4
MINIAERHQYILNKIQTDGSIDVQSLCKKLNVSSVTIRKDLKLLEDKNLLFRTHGGATLNNPYTVDRPVNEKEHLQSAEKMRIGALAAGLIEDNDSIIIASGTTVLAMARCIKPKGSLTVLTSALNVALELLNHADVEIIQLGGLVRKSSASVAGPYSDNVLGNVFCSKLYLGVDGIDLEFGLTTTSASEAHLNKQMIESSQKVIVLADSTKFGKRGFGKICGIEAVDHIITDSGIPDQVKKGLESHGIKVSII